MGSRFKKVQWETQFLRLGIAGDTGTGKTMSSVLLALGITDVLGGRVAMLNMDARRAAEYHTLDFDVDHMEPPFTSQKVSAAIKDAVADGYTVLILDGMEKEHQEMLDWQLDVWDAKHKEACEKAARFKKPEPSRAAFSRIAWGVVKPPRKELVTTIESAPIHLILTFAAEQKQDENFKDLGWIPNAGKRVLKALKWLALLKPGADGRPSWNPEKGEHDIVKNPEYLRPAPKVLTREVGARFARWARGDHLRKVEPPTEPATPPADPVPDLLARMDRVQTVAGLAAMDPEIHGHWPNLSRKAQQAIKHKAAEVRARLGVPQ